MGQAIRLRCDPHVPPRRPLLLHPSRPLRPNVLQADQGPEPRRLPVQQLREGTCRRQRPGVRMLFSTLCWLVCFFSFLYGGCVGKHGIDRDGLLFGEGRNKARHACEVFDVEGYQMIYGGRPPSPSAFAANPPSFLWGERPRRSMFWWPLLMDPSAGRGTLAWWPAWRYWRTILEREKFCNLLFRPMRILLPEARERVHIPLIKISCTFASGVASAIDPL